MTVVRTTEPPRLPVRDKAAARARGWGGVSPMLTRLAAERATGVLVREHGTLHLAEGLVVQAESRHAPGLGALLTAHGTLAPEAWHQAVNEAADHHRVGRHLVDAGHLPLGALELCHLAALYDAAYFVLAPSSTPPRFRYGPVHWLGSVRPVPVEALERETLRRRDVLHRIWPHPGMDGIPLARTHLPGTPALTRRQLAVLELVDGVRTATDIARTLGHLAFHTLVDVRRLTAAGVVTTAAPARVQPPPGGTRDASDRGQPPPPPDQPPTVHAQLPGRGRSPQGRGQPHRPDPAGADGYAPPVPAEPLPPDPHITLLKRLRDALEAL